MHPENVHYDQPVSLQMSRFCSRLSFVPEKQKQKEKPQCLNSLFSAVSVAVCTASTYITYKVEMCRLCHSVPRLFSIQLIYIVLFSLRISVQVPAKSPGVWLIGTQLLFQPHCRDSPR